jgi:phosphocarrier protein HPr
MVEESFEIKNKLGFHARAAVQFVKLASSFKSDIKVKKDSLVVCGKSIMGVLMLAASKGTTVTILADGEDEEIALKSLGELINNGFGENE